MEHVKGPDMHPEQRLEHLIETYQTQLLRLCYLFLHDATQAEDAVQETFLKAYRSLSDFRGESSEKTWLTRIAVNTCRDELRGSWLRHTDRSVTPEMLPEASVPFEARDEALTLAVMKLPRRQREVTLLYYYQDMSLKEIASALGLAQSTVSYRLKCARERLRGILEGGGTNE